MFKNKIIEVKGIEKLRSVNRVWLFDNVRDLVDKDLIIMQWETGWASSGTSLSSEKRMMLDVPCPGQVTQYSYSVGVHAIRSTLSAQCYMNWLTIR